mmetsp:Transcript_5317/g.7195  ORF Transcript_5317/g.7195 Transcript_5317/m.7195 type:complete len:128 (+) Transcript_5317:163-546(+)|eukprot:CAMPEP_0196575756 /NCGR_PEP_ID=MMETSP1081-20130531/5175_1 /TAXON_ID=36882 /ORGANISM="Pyramimonas amylifera, Strain CCMP720" /LENGTH=127 /DNA_ID=CAMNT_0041894157 /DNA_START=163 /DNA_END=546 /DNA_ORIENTATION=+
MHAYYSPSLQSKVCGTVKDKSSIQIRNFHRGTLLTYKNNQPLKKSRANAFYVVAGPQPDLEEDGVLDFPQEWQKPGPSRRPDIFPEFTPIKPPLPQPMPGDPEEPEEPEEGEEGEENPDEEPPPEEE